MVRSEKVLLYYDISPYKSREVDQILKICKENKIAGVCINLDKRDLSNIELIGILDVLKSKMELLILTQRSSFSNQLTSEQKLRVSLAHLFAMQKEYVNLKIVSCAQSIVEAKNEELEPVDFIEFQLTKQNESELQDILPKKEAYGWSLLSFNKPLLVSGIQHLSHIESLVKKTTVQGLIISNDFESNSNPEQQIQQVLEMLIQH